MQGLTHDNEDLAARCDALATELSAVEADKAALAAELDRIQGALAGFRGDAEQLATTSAENRALKEQLGR